MSLYEVTNDIFATYRSIQDIQASTHTHTPHTHTHTGRHWSLQGKYSRMSLICSDKTAMPFAHPGTSQEALQLRVKQVSAPTGSFIFHTLMSLHYRDASVTVPRLPAYTHTHTHTHTRQAYVYPFKLSTPHPIMQVVFERLLGMRR